MTSLPPWAGARCDRNSVKISGCDQLILQQNQRPEMVLPTGHGALPSLITHRILKKIVINTNRILKTINTRSSQPNKDERQIDNYTPCTLKQNIRDLQISRRYRYTTSNNARFTTERFYNRQNTSLPQFSTKEFSSFSLPRVVGIHRVSNDPHCNVYRLDESRWKKKHGEHTPRQSIPMIGEMLALAVIDDNDREQLLFSVGYRYHEGKHQNIADLAVLPNLILYCTPYADDLRECNCRCDEDVDDDILHYIFRCPLLDSQRSLIRPGQSVLQILQDKHRTKEVNSLLFFLFLRVGWCGFNGTRANLAILRQTFPVSCFFINRISLNRIQKTFPNAHEH
ncbi:hypothetical protein AVEN_82530-1 [Araneus ventricosus]|uniref:Uncharacterized protein n=1 Tax=Araneus ventricosus TaxID=182803 RepID=A0A4Y2GM92_ARAVE|nr:hypothetical protein AVEN_82530-1 [Araneus ventricosus]